MAHDVFALLFARACAPQRPRRLQRHLRRHRVLALVQHGDANRRYPWGLRTAKPPLRSEVKTAFISSACNAQRATCPKESELLACLLPPCCAFLMCVSGCCSERAHREAQSHKDKALAVIQRVDQKGKAVVVAGSKSSCEDAAKYFREIGMTCEVRPLRAEDMPSEYEDSGHHHPRHPAPG